MKITSIDAVYPNYNYTVGSWRTHLWQIVVRVETDTGQTGWGFGGGGKSAVEIVNGHFAEILVGRSVNSLTTEDMLLSYVLAAYLVEARPEEAVVLLRRIGAGESSQAAVESVLDLDLAQLGRRLRRWLDERIAEERSADR